MHQYKRAIIAHIGPMFGGKTSALMSNITKFKIAGYDTVLFKPLKDDRYDTDKVVNHDGEKLNAVNIIGINDVIEFIKENPNIDVIGIDEFQMLKDKLFTAKYMVESLIETILKYKKTLIISGLDLDSELKPFDNVKEILPYCTHINKHKAVCMKCGSDATTTRCKVEKSDQELVGGSDIYEPICYNCRSKK